MSKIRVPFREQRPRTSLLSVVHGGTVACPAEGARPSRLGPVRDAGYQGIMHSRAAVMAINVSTSARVYL